jgi:hypothetical protein
MMIAAERVGVWPVNDSGPREGLPMNWRQLGLAACITAICLAIFLNKDDVDRYLRMRNM